MKKLFLPILLFTIIVTFSTESVAQKFPTINASPMDAASYPDNWRESNKLVKVIYSRPQLKGRELSKLAPNDKVWRTGANEATEITFYKDVTFGDKKVKAGSYTLFTIPNENEWTIIVNKAKNVWGAYFYDEAEDVVRVSGKVATSKENIEAFSIVFEEEKDNVMMYLGWGTTVVSVPITFEASEKE